MLQPLPGNRGQVRRLPSDAEILQRSPLGDQLLMTHEAVAGLLVRLDAVLVPERGELLPQSIEDGMVVVQGTEAYVQTLTEVEDASQPGFVVLRQRAPALLAGSPRRSPRGRSRPAGSLLQGGQGRKQPR